MRKPLLIAGAAVAVIALGTGSALATEAFTSHSATVHHVVVADPTPKPKPVKKHHRHHRHVKIVYVPTQPATPPSPDGPTNPAPAAPSQPQLTDATAVVLQFYQYITDQNYQAAWAIGGDNIGGSDYNGWVAGYDTTSSVDVTAYGTYSDGTVWTHLTAYQTDGTVKTYDGTYTVANGAIVSANMTQTS